MFVNEINNNTLHIEYLYFLYILIIKLARTSDQARFLYLATQLLFTY